MPKQPKLEYLTTPRLKERGWTDAMIKKFLGEPDATRDNPHYKCAAPMKLYDTKRVERVERRKSFKEYMEASAGRKQSAQKSVQTKLEKALEYARSVGTNVPTMDTTDLSTCNVDVNAGLKVPVTFVRWNYPFEVKRGS